MTDAEKIIFLEDAMKNHEKRIRELEKRPRKAKRNLKSWSNSGINSKRHSENYVDVPSKSSPMDPMPT